jgi:crotonobetainyl-CoA:carnitine CoA-transferase CaiB-like acyl-CoA transferase
MSITGEADGKPGGGPQKVGIPIVDIMTGMYTAVAVLAALERRRESGLGDFIDIAMLDVQISFLANQAMNFLLSDKPPRRSGNQHPNIQPQDVFQCRDGYFALACGNDGQFTKISQLLGRADWATDDRFRTNAARVRNVSILRPLLAEDFASRDVAECVAMFDAAGIPCGPINSVPQALVDPQIVHREMVRDIPHPTAGTVPQVVSPMRFRESPLTFDTPPPMLGQHTEEVLAELGLDRNAIEALRAKGVV